uniref:NADH-ubiquinone oxidoreductase chain 2 n=1 Tax=Ophichthus brevicaudatus TaxID=1867744 RepID=A0A5J6YF01_9TELE|nr:NADH dehydrogenase subunit 2 [Ophichthus brevicaudatus]QXF68544.1 NADH dehydrogenase subunit 2 [Ophichthus brevicaudatus]
MSPYVITIILLSLGLGTTITFASSHWLLAWMGLEINTLAILPLMAQNHHPRAVEATTKYFLTQATAAAVILFSTMVNAWYTGSWEIQQAFHPTIMAITVLSLGLKVGLAPMHFWLPEVLQGLDLTTGLILSTWQKIAPMTLIYQISLETNQNMMMTLGLISALVGGWGGLNQTQLRKVLAYSSIAHMGWMFMVLSYAPNLMMMNLIIYIIMTYTAFTTLKISSATKINTLATSWAKAPAITAVNLVTMLSLAGLPPLTGFMPKWLILQELTKQGLPLLATLMAMTALLSLFFYLRICYTMSLTISPNTNNTKTPWRLKSKQMTLPLSIAAAMTAMLLPTTPTVMAVISTALL